MGSLLPVPPDSRRPDIATAAWDAGRELALSVAGELSEAEQGAEAYVEQSAPHLAAAGVAIEVVRARPGCLVISARADWESLSEGAVRFLAGWLQSVSHVIGGEGCTILESSQTTTRGPVRVFTLLWVPRAQTGSFRLRELPAGEGTTIELPDDAVIVEDDDEADYDHDWSEDGAGGPPEPPKPPSGSGPPFRGSRRSARRPRYGWLRRRGWMVVVGLIAGLAGGAGVASMHHAKTYMAANTLEVRSGASSDGPGGASDAEELAITYAAALPNDQVVLKEIGSDLGMSVADVSAHISAAAEAGTALVQAGFTASTAATAVRGADAIAAVVASDRASGQAIAGGSVVVVSSADSATSSNLPSSYGVVLGAILGLLVGAGMAFLTERTDRRVDDVDSLAEASGAHATEWPGGLTALELVRGLQRNGNGPEVTVVPLHEAQVAAASLLAAGMSRAAAGEVRGGSPRTRLDVNVTAAFDSQSWEPDLREAPVVLVVGPGERFRTVRELTERLQMLRASPALSVLDLGKAKNSKLKVRR